MRLSSIRPCDIYTFISYDRSNLSVDTHMIDDWVLAGVAKK
jgi:hypothetical protein